MPEGLGPKGREVLARIREEKGEKIPALEASDELYEKIYIDERTKLPNDKAFSRDAKQAIKEAERGETENLALVMVDIDDFREFNKKYGHLCGDKVLSEIASVLKSNAQENEEENIRQNVTAYRYGGEELTIIIKNLSQDGAEQLAERIRREVENKKVEYNGQFVGTTLSLGLAFWQRGEDYPQLVGRADAAQIKAKNLGKNRLKLA